MLWVTLLKLLLSSFYSFTSPLPTPTDGRPASGPGGVGDRGTSRTSVRFLFPGQGAAKVKLGRWRSGDLEAVASSGRGGGAAPWRWGGLLVRGGRRRAPT